MENLTRQVLTRGAGGGQTLRNVPSTENKNITFFFAYFNLFDNIIKH